LEVYRWYDTRLLGVRNLLLERRAKPRFTRLTSLGTTRFALGSDLNFPASGQPVFWTMSCNLSTKGKLRKLLFRIPEVMMKTDPAVAPGNEFRVIPEVLIAPVLGSVLPGNLDQFAALLKDHGGLPPAVPPTLKTLSFGGPGRKYYEPNCQVEFLQPDWRTAP
jgi:hypothetical protein